MKDEIFSNIPYPSGASTDDVGSLELFHRLRLPVFTQATVERGGNWPHRRIAAILSEHIPPV